MIPYCSRQDISHEDIQAVIDAIVGLLTQGPQVPRFERALCEYTGASCACS